MKNKIEEVMNDDSYPSDVDNMVRNDTPFEGTATSLPPKETNPVMGSDGKLPVTKVSKVTN